MKLSQVTDKIYKSKNDIPYLKLLALGQDIKGNETDLQLVAQKVYEYFKISDLDKFNKALYTQPKKIKFTYKVKIDLSKATDFIDADIFQSTNDIEAVLRLCVKPKNKFQKVDVHKMNYAEVEDIMKSFL
ncbi:hypothetical protein GKZ90_0021030 [Flavobacterium sp. MC2016-06]|jgi:hypothetical protein|uniref:hypothetical protein n=1 Tax=Flavobacterium sp. MC2016-06 TaxID=2676308 RepID=UPI0012BA8A2C|nr:hypothetical protein [Flavobacterium sp. MC2016-06]MBU3860985.1 hypothetical protein [Flavobacterium sp. MC2016-06]